MREANTFDLSLLILLAIIWGSSFFNIKIATYSYDPITLALVRVIFASIPLLILCKISRIKIEIGNVIDSPIDVEHNDQKINQNNAETNINEDKDIQNFINKFDGKIKPESIKPIK